MISPFMTVTMFLVGLLTLAAAFWVFKKAELVVATANAAVSAHRALTERMPPEEIRIRLDDAEFRDLVAGKEVVCRDLEGTRVRMILADIGWDRMRMHISNASKEAST
jgi:hypothetical protein